MAKSAKDKIQYEGKRCKFRKNGEGAIILSKVVRKSSLLWHLRGKKTIVDKRVMAIWERAILAENTASP